MRDRDRVWVRVRARVRVKARVRIRARVRVKNMVQTHISNSIREADVVLCCVVLCCPAMSWSCLFMFSSVV